MATTLSAQLTAGVTTATVVSTALFPATGVIVIENERISYTGKTGTTFTGLTRGLGGTTDATHAIAVAVIIAPAGITLVSSDSAVLVMTPTDSAVIALTPTDGLAGG